MLENNPHYSAINQAFPHIGSKLRLYWGQQDFVHYMAELMHDTRNGQRRGFSFDVVVALTSIAEDHRTEFPHLDPRDDVWSMAHPNLL